MRLVIHNSCTQEKRISEVHSIFFTLKCLSNCSAIKFVNILI
jgi:hypothetical protein